MMAATRLIRRLRRPGAGLAAVAASCVLASCAVAPTSTQAPAQRTAQFSSRDYGVEASPRVVAEGRRVPRGGGREMVGRPYTVAGRTYVPQEDPNYSAVGMASWYGSNFHGRLTANGEVYDVGAITAAHPTMPLPSYARVTNLATGASLVVRVNDRGPFHSNRVIDVSERAADMLGMRRTGVAEVRVEYVGRAPLDGRDQRTLMASYRPGNGDQGGRAFALSRDRRENRFVVADAGRTVRAALRGTDGPVALAAPADKPARRNPFAERNVDDLFEVTPAALGEDDPLAPLLTEATEARSYAPARELTAAQLAAQSLALAEPVRGAAGASLTVQVGMFGEKENAERIAGLLATFGAVTTSPTEGRNRTLWRVTVGVADETAADAVIAAAADAGATGAYRLGR